MKLEDAAALLGVPVDAPMDVLKLTYRNLALAWHPDKVRDFNAARGLCIYFYLFIV